MQRNDKFTGIKAFSFDISPGHLGAVAPAVVLIGYDFAAGSVYSYFIAAGLLLEKALSKSLLTLLMLRELTFLFVLYLPIQ